MSGEEASICGGSDPARNKCNNGKYFTDVWYQEWGEERPYYVDIGVRNGACILEMLLETNARILAFEPHPQNVYRITRTIKSLDRALRRRVTLFPIGLSDAPMEDEIPFRSDGKTVMLPVRAERLDSLLDRVNLPPNTKMVVNLEVDGFVCQILDGMRDEAADAVQFMKLKWEENSVGKCADGEDFLQKLRSEFHLDTWSRYAKGEYSNYLLPGHRPKSLGANLFVTRRLEVPI